MGSEKSRWFSPHAAMQFTCQVVMPNVRMLSMAQLFLVSLRSVVAVVLFSVSGVVHTQKFEIALIPLLNV